MSLENFYFISQIIAAFGVLASVIYLALQTRQTARNHMTALHLARATEAFGNFFKFADPLNASVILAGDAGKEPLSDVQFRQYLSLRIGLFISIEEQYRQYREGNLDASRWRSTERNLPILLGQPGTRAICRMFQMLADKDFSALLDNAMIQARTRPSADPKAIWMTMVAEEFAAEIPTANH